nr:hypothetical protein [Desulfobacterales bacterium]
MTYWNYREVLSRQDKLRRSVYETLRDELDSILINYALIDSYWNFRKNNIPYPFVQKRELKPRARVPDIEYEYHNRFLVIFVEDTIPPVHKKYIHFFDGNKVTKENLLQSSSIHFSKKYFKNLKIFENSNFALFLKDLLPVDYALLIQRDPTVKARNRYMLSHFHVRIDWPISDAAEDLGKYLRYISKDLYEKGDSYAEEIRKKFFEYYGLAATVGGRRTAAAVAAQYLRRLPCISTVYVVSSEARSLCRISERGLSRYTLIKITEEEIKDIVKNNSLNMDSFRENYLIDMSSESGVGIFQTIYDHTVHARPPEDGKLRELNSDLFWLTVVNQLLLPKPNEWRCPPLPYSTIYT